jgi:hypothetical protein
MTLAVKQWKDWPDLSTPISGAALTDMEQRVSTEIDVSGASLTTLKNVRPINVMDSLVPFADVKRDGVTDDSAALQLRHDLADTQDRAIYYPGSPNAYLASGLTVGDNAQISGDFGATILKLPNSAAAVGGHRFIFRNKNAATVGATGIRITGITFDGNVAGSNAVDEFYFGIQMYGVRSFGIDWCVFRNLRGDGIYVNRSTTGVENEDFFIDHIFLNNVGVDAGAGAPRQGISVVQGRRFTIRNVVGNKVGGPAGTSYIVDLEPNSSADAIEDFTIDGIHGYDCMGGVSILQLPGGSTKRGFVNNISLKDGPTNTIQDVVHITLADSIHVGSGIYSDTTPATGLLIWLSGPSPPTNFTCDATKVETKPSRAATTTIQANTRLVIQGGSGPISSVVATWASHVVTFQIPSGVSFTDGSNLLLAGNFAPGSTSTITMICDGVNWNEIGRSTN